MTQSPKNPYLRQGKDQPFSMDGDDTWWEHGPYDTCQHGYQVCVCTLCQAICPFLIDQYMKEKYDDTV